MAGYIYEKFSNIDAKTTNDRLQVQKNINERLGGMSLVPLTKTEYTVLTPKDSSTVYLVNDNGSYSLYVGDTQISGSGGDGIVIVENGIIVRNYGEYTGAPIDGYLPGEGAAYTPYHTELNHPSLSRDTKVYDGGKIGKFIPGPGPYRYILRDSTNSYIGGSINDGLPYITVNLVRNGTPETLTYEVFTARVEVTPTRVGMTTFISEYRSYMIRCSRVKNGSTKSWWYTGGFNGFYRRPVSYSDPDGQKITTDAYGIPGLASSGSNWTRTNFPILTLAFNNDSPNEFLTSTPYLALVVGSETLTTTGGTTYSRVDIPDYRILTEFGDPGMQLGLLYDPETAQLYSDVATMATAPTGVYLQAAKIESYDISEDV